MPAAPHVVGRDDCCAELSCPARLGLLQRTRGARRKSPCSASNSARASQRRATRGWDRPPQRCATPSARRRWARASSTRVSCQARRAACFQHRSSAASASASVGASAARTDSGLRAGSCRIAPTHPATAIASTQPSQAFPTDRHRRHLRVQAAEVSRAIMGHLPNVAFVVRPHCAHGAGPPPALA